MKTQWLLGYDSKFQIREDSRTENSSSSVTSVMILEDGMCGHSNTLQQRSIQRTLMAALIRLIRYEIIQYFQYRMALNYLVLQGFDALNVLFYGIVFFLSHVEIFSQNAEVEILILVKTRNTVSGELWDKWPWLCLFIWRY